MSPEASQAIGRSISPRLMPRSLITPNWSLSIHAHIRAETMVGIAQGISTAARTQPRPRNSWFSTSAIAMPSTVSTLTVTSAKRTVFHTAFHQSAEASRPKYSPSPSP